MYFRQLDPWSFTGVCICVYINTQVYMREWHNRISLAKICGVGMYIEVGSAINTINIKLNKAITNNMTTNKLQIKNYKYKYKTIMFLKLAENTIVATLYR